MNRVITKEDDERTFIQLEDEELKEGEADSILQYLADCLRATQIKAKHTRDIALAKITEQEDGIYLDLTTADRYRDHATYSQGITAATPEQSKSAKQKTSNENPIRYFRKNGKTTIKRRSPLTSQSAPTVWRRWTFTAPRAPATWRR